MIVQADWTAASSGTEADFRLLPLNVSHFRKQGLICKRYEFVQISSHKTRIQPPSSSGRQLASGSTLALGMKQSVFRNVLPPSSNRCRGQRMKVQAVVQEPPKKDVRKPRSENVGLDQTGAFFVDHTCIGALNLGQLLSIIVCRRVGSSRFGFKKLQANALAIFRPSKGSTMCKSSTDGHLNRNVLFCGSFIFMTHVCRLRYVPLHGAGLLQAKEQPVSSASSARDERAAPPGFPSPPLLSHVCSWPANLASAPVLKTF